MTEQKKQSAAQRVAERLRVLAWAVEKMREGVPDGNRPVDLAEGRFAREHDEMLTTLIVGMQRFVAPLELDIPEEHYRHPGCA